MLTFLRKIRRSLIESGSARKYLLYAIGEILLVVVGILIALQINNWNQEKHERTKEEEILKELSTTLQSDLEVFKSGLAKVRTAERRMRSLQTHLSSGTRVDSINVLFGAPYGLHIFKLNTSTYEVLKSNGFDMILDDSIRTLTVKIFDTHLKYIDGVNAIENNVVLDLLRPYYLTHFKEIRFLQSAVPIDIDKIYADDYYRNLIDYRIEGIQFNFSTYYPTIVADANELLQRIDAYLAKK